MNLKIKSFITVTFMTVVISVVIVYITLKNSDEVLQNNLKKELRIDIQKIDNHLSDAKEKLQNISQSIVLSEKVISTLNLISNYEDKNNYNALIFDIEKRDLLDYSERYFGKNEFFEILFYDKSNALIAKKLFHPTLGQGGYVTYDDGVAYLRSNKELLMIDESYNLQKECIGKVMIRYEDSYYKICENRTVMFGEDLIGHIKIIYYFGKEELSSLERNLIYPISLTTQAPEQKAFDITILNKELGVYIKHDIDFSYIKQKRQELIVTIIFVVILMTGFIFWFFFAFINKEVLNPLKKLQISLESILLNSYKPIKVKNRDEIGRIFDSSNKIFKKFWESYSSLQSYKKGVETSNLVTKTDLKGVIIYANDLFCQTSEYKKDEVIGKPHSIVRHPDMDKEIFREMWETIKDGKTWRGVIKNKTKSGGFYWADAVISPTYDLNEQIEGYVSIRRDITELMQSKEDLEFRANYDLLTKLGSRDRLHLDLKKSINPSLALINIDRFSQVNDFYGHEFGDKILQEFSKLLQYKLDELFADRYSLYRYGGDEFAVLIKKYDREEIQSKFSNLLDEIEQKSIKVDEKEFNLNLSCGISFEDSSIALLSADMAMKISKNEQKTFVVYSEENTLNKKYENNLLWATKLKASIEEDRVVPFFQPIVNNSTLAYEKYEALVRIIEPDGKVISPFFFLDVAKQTKKYHKLTKIMVEKSFAMFKEKKGLEFSINLTVDDISCDHMRGFLFGHLDANPEIAKRLVLEIVESESIEDYAQMTEFISIAKSKGCKVAIDDFGSGYSNFEYLIKLQADYIKIDGSLIKNITTQRESFVVVSTIVNFAKEMGIKTIAEFIENEEIFQKAKEIGIDYSQGYYFSPPKDKV